MRGLARLTHSDVAGLGDGLDGVRTSRDLPGARVRGGNGYTVPGFELVERSFEHTLDRGGMRRVHLRGRENVHKRYLIHVAGFNLGLLMRARFGVGTPRGWADRVFVLIFASQESSTALLLFLMAVAGPGWRLLAAAVIREENG